MSWTGTVECSFCRYDGHNRRGCPKRKKRVQGLRDLGHTAGDSWLVSEDDRYKSSRPVKRRCSYCLENGHNVRTCSSLKADLSWIAEADQVWRHKVVDHYRQKYPGMGYGALIKTSYQAYVRHSEDHPFGSTQTVSPIFMLREVVPEHYTNFWTAFCGFHRSVQLLSGRMIESSVEPAYFEDIQNSEKFHIEASHSPGIINMNFDHGDRSIEIVAPQSTKSFDYMWSAFLAKRISKKDFAGYNGDMKMWRENLKSNIKTIHCYYLRRLDPGDTSNTINNFSYIFEACGPPPSTVA